MASKRTQAKIRKKALDKRYRAIELSASAAKIVARATGHHVTDGWPNYVLDTNCNRTHRDARTRNHARDMGYVLIDR